MEFAVLLPVLLLLVAGVLEWGRIVVHDVALVQVARDAALTGARTEAEDDPAGVARSRANAALEELGLSGSVEVDSVSLDSGEALQVQVRVAWPGRIPIVPTPEWLTATVTARLEDQ